MLALILKTAFVRFEMNLHSIKNINQIEFPRNQSPRRWPTLVLMAGVVLVLFSSNCRNAGKIENRKPKTIVSTLG